MPPRLDQFDLRERVFVVSLYKRVAESVEGISQYFWMHHEVREALWHEWHNGLSKWSAAGEPDLNHVARVLLGQWLERQRRR